jgi:AraC family L-rhamnose operon transcriptional activator RhaR/AraC family L-rhamnose operon regulatory protein RhaS
LKLCNIQFDPKQFLADGGDLHRMAGFHALFDLEPRSRCDGRAEQRLRLSGAQSAAVGAMVQELKREFDSDAEGRQTMIRAMFLRLVTALSRMYGQVSAAPSPTTRMAGVVSHIRRAFRQPIHVQELARMAHLSPSQFQRVFRRHYQTSPVQFINRLRIEEACELLGHTHREVAWIARETGFSSVSFFCTQFRRRVGMSPTQYRRQHQDSQSPSPLTAVR